MEKKPLEAYYLADDGDYGRNWFPAPASAWWYDGRGAKELERNYAPYSISNERGEAPTGMTRELRKTAHGVVTVFASVNIKSGFDGLFIRLYDLEGNDAAVIYTKNGGYYALGRNQKEKLLFEEQTPTGLHVFKIVLNFETKKVRYYVDDMFGAELPLTAKYIKFYKIGTFAGSVIDVTMGETRIHANYILNEHFSLYAPHITPSEWTKDCAEDADVFTENGNLVLTSATGAEASLSKEFEPLCGKYAFESFFFMPKFKAGAHIKLLAGKKTALDFYSADGNFCADGKSIRYALDEMWYRLRFEIDTAKKQILIKINGKNIETVKIPAGAAAIDSVCFSLSGDDVTWLCDRIKLFPLIDYPDYCPKPKLPKGKDDYVIGMNMCSLWHTGSHIGWDCITPYPEIKPVLGYYDEGLPEVADWEIKWMAEHGLDFELYCWYNSQVNAPICTTGLSAAIHGGHFNAKYGDYMKFALLWEAMNCAHPSVEAFRKHIVPYWMDYFFSDPRYFTIDNKVLIAVFGSGNLIKDFGSVEAVKEQLDYVREEVKKLGFDGAIFLSCGGPTEAVRDCGFDGVYAYNWGTQGFDPDYTKAQITSQREKKLVPTVSTGFNRIGWGSPRTPQMTCEDMGECLRWFKEDVLPTSEGEDWKKKLVMFSTWNEYGEGTYICPSNLHGFGYLDEMRKAFTNESASHTDIRPDEHQLDRLGYLYPKGRSLIRCEQYLEKCKPTEHVDDIPTDAAYWQPENRLVIQNRDGKLCGTTDKFDPQILHTGLSIDANEVKGVHIRLKANSGGGANTCVYFITDTDSAWSESKGVHVFIKGDVVTDVYYDMASLPTWTGTITGLRLDPTDIAGSFEIEAIELTTDTTSPIITVDGEIHTPSVLPKITDKGVFIPFEQNRPYKALKFYHEWYRDEQTLYLLHGKTAMYFTVGKDYVLVNGKKHKLPEPLALCDALPMLSLDVLCDLCGFSYTVEGRYIRILSNEKK